MQAVIFCPQALLKLHRGHTEEPKTPWRKLSQKTEPNQRARCKEVHLGALEKWLLWHSRLPEMGRADLQSIDTQKLTFPTQSWGHWGQGCVNSGSEGPPVQQTFSMSPYDSSHRPPVSLPKKYQPLPPEPESSRPASPQRHTLPEVQRGAR